MSSRSERRGSRSERRWSGRQTGGSSTGWAGFTADPRNPQAAQIRASDADRQHADRVLREALDEGRLTSEEYNARVSSAHSVRMLGDFVPLLSDVMVQRPTPLVSGFRRDPNFGPMRGWAIGMAVLIAIWLVTSIAAGGVIYFWPIWPIIFTGIPFAINQFAGSRKPPSAQPVQQPPQYRAGAIEAPSSDPNSRLIQPPATGRTPQQEEYPLYRPDDLR